MTLPGQMPNDQNLLSKGMALLGSLPSPEKLYAELQRLNANLERMNMPQALIEIQRLNHNFDSLKSSSQDIRNLVLTLQNMKLSELFLLLSDANSTIKALYEKLWGQVPKARK